MCGIAGILTSVLSQVEILETVQNMARQLAPRGPDADGYWVDEHSQVVVELSDLGAQPMHSQSSRYCIVYNGEVYNHKSLRKEMIAEGCKFRGESDTEVILEAIDLWGIKRAINKFVGMFAFAVWDKQNRELILARDRMGEKPLYYGQVSGKLLFASELKAISACKGWSRELDQNALSLFLRHNCIPSPYSIYKNIFKVPPGATVTIRFEKQQLAVEEPRKYWSVLDNIHPVNHDISADDAISELDGLIRNSVSSQMLADVPLGAFLSGGVDSSCIVAIMQSLSNRPVKTFSIGFKEQQYNEAEHAKAVANYLGTEHTEFYVSSNDALNVIPEMGKIYDEPFSDSSQLPTYLLSQLTQTKVTVSLSGDAGDELFGGYDRYLWGNRIWNSISWAPLFFRRLTSSGLRIVPPGAWDKVYSPFSKLVAEKRRIRNFGDKLYKLASVLSLKNPRELYTQFVSHWDESHDILKKQNMVSAHLNEQIWCRDDLCFTEKMMYQDMVCYLPDDILVKVDRAAMAVSLETRVPLLDHRIVEFALKLPMHLKVRKGVGKWLLRQVLYKYVPNTLIDRPKMGFGVPMDSWLRGPLKEWCLDMLAKDKLNREQILNVDIVQKHLNEHMSGKRNWAYYLWDLLMFETWMENEKN